VLAEVYALDKKSKDGTLVTSSDIVITIRKAFQRRVSTKHSDSAQELLVIRNLRKKALHSLNKEAGVTSQ
jgi:hypothetical protein